MKKKLGQILIGAGLLTPERLDECLALQKTQSKLLGQILVENGYVSELDIALSLAFQMNLLFVELEKIAVDPEAVVRVDEELARRHQVFPFHLEGTSLMVAVADPLNAQAIEDVEFYSGCRVRPAVALAGNIETAIDSHYRLVEKLSKLVASLPEPTPLQLLSLDAGGLGNGRAVPWASEAAPVVRIVNQVLAEMADPQVSELHLEPGESQVKVRRQLDGRLQDCMVFPKWVQGALTSRLKLLSHLKTFEKRFSQDGALLLRVGDRKLHLRLSTYPARYGEKIVMRVLRHNAVPALSDLGMSEDALALFRELAAKPRGMVLVTGPAGSGKSQILAAALGHLANGALKIITLEDPIEYELSGVKQIQVNERAGAGYALGLRSVLRERPDVILVQEIKDEEAASTAFSAASSHLVFSALLAHRAIRAVRELTDKGIPAYLVGSTLTAALAPALLRLICHGCRVPYQPKENELARVKELLAGSLPKAFYQGNGCSECRGSGYRGRKVLYELFRVTDAVKELIFAGASEDKIEEAAQRSGMETLPFKAGRELAAGHTTIDELLRLASLAPSSIDCQQCGAPTVADAGNCPYCDFSRLSACGSCGNPSQPDWKYCPYCRDALSSRATPRWSGLLRVSSRLSLER